MLISFDYKSFHVLTLGFEAKCARYMRMSRLDMHSFFALCGLLKKEPAEKLEALPDAELVALLKWYRKQPTLFPEYGGKTFQEIRDEKAKRAILGIGFGQQEYSLYRLNPESFDSPSEAKKVLTFLDALFPKPAQWRKDVRLEADRAHCLLTRYGFVRYFWDVYHRRPVPANYYPRRGDQFFTDSHGLRWLLAPGDDHEACIAFRPANDAFGLIRERIAEIGFRGLDTRYGLINTVHDSVVFDCPSKFVDECLHEIKGILERPSKVLVDVEVAPHGLWCAAEAKIGMNLAEMKEVVV